MAGEFGEFEIACDSRDSALMVMIVEMASMGIHKNESSIVRTT